MKKFFEEFKTFALKGNVIDLAVGVVIGSAFTAIVNSIVNDIIMPVVGIIIGGHDFSSLAVTVGEAQIKYGSLIQCIVNFLIIAFVLFLVVKAMNTVKAKMEKKKEAEEAAEEPKKSEDVALLEEIRDALNEIRNK